MNTRGSPQAVAHDQLAPVAAGTAGGECEVLSLDAGLARYESEWSQLVDSTALNPSLLPGWMRIVAANNGIAHHAKLLVHRDGGRVMGVVPYFAQPARILGITLKKISLISNLVSYHADLPCAGSRLNLLQALLRSEPGWQVLQVDNILPDGSMAVALEQLGQDLGGRLLTYPVDFAPYLPIAQPFDALVATMDKKFRYKYRKRQESLGDHTGLSMRWFTQPDEVQAFLDAMLAVEARSWKAREGVAVAAATHEGSYYAKLLPYLAAQGDLLANVLFQADTPVAYNLCCHHGAWVGQLKTAFDISLEQLSPGALVIDSAIRAAFERGAREFDFLGTPGKSAPEPHKLFWTKHVRSHISCFLFAPRPVPRLIAAVKHWRQARA